MSKPNPFADLESLRQGKDGVNEKIDEQFAQETAKLEQEAAKQRSKWRREFVRVPWEWVARLRTAKRISSWRLAVLLLYEHWRTDGRDVALSNILARDVGLSRRSKSRGLNELENLDLVEVKRRRRTAPLIALKHLKRN